MVRQTLLSTSHRRTLERSRKRPVDHEKDNFQPVAALLKAWSVPFDVLRLDHEHLDGTYLFSRSGDIRYGVGIWLADAPSYSNQDVTSLEHAVHAGTGLLVVKSRFLDSALERLVGLRFKEPTPLPIPSE